MKFIVYSFTHRCVIALSKQDATVALFANRSTELTETSGEEGIPHMRLFGIWGRLILAENETDDFCQLYGYKTGKSIVNVRSYSGYIWSEYPRIKCLMLRRHSDVQCIDELLKLENEWYDGPYVVCQHEGTYVQESGREAFVSFYTSGAKSSKNIY